MKYEQQLAKHLTNESIITHDEAVAITEGLSHKKFSLHWELRVLLYTGITLFTSGLGIFIYNNIGSIGHIILILLLFAGCLVCYYYAFTKALPYSRESVQHPNPFYDYVVLSGALLFISAQGYLQFHFLIYGNELSIPTLVSSLVLFVTAFRFDHKGVLTLAISLFATFFGLVVTPLEWMHSDTFEIGQQDYIQSGLMLGILLYGYGWICRNQSVKVHFVNIFLQFAANVLLVCLLSGTFGNHLPGLYYLGLLAAGFLFFKEARKLRSFALFLSVVLAEYIGITYWVMRGLFHDSDGAIYAAFLYFMLSGLGTIYLLRNHKTILRYD